MFEPLNPSYYKKNMFLICRVVSWSVVQFVPTLHPVVELESHQADALFTRLAIAREGANTVLPIEIRLVT